MDVGCGGQKFNFRASQRVERHVQAFLCVTWLKFAILNLRWNRRVINQVSKSALNRRASWRTGCFCVFADGASLSHAASAEIRGVVGTSDVFIQILNTYTRLWLGLRESCRDLVNRIQRCRRHHNCGPEFRLIVALFRIRGIIQKRKSVFNLFWYLLFCPGLIYFRILCWRLFLEINWRCQRFSINKFGKLWFLI